MTSGNGQQVGVDPRLMRPRPPFPPFPSAQASIPTTEDADFGELVKRTAEDAVHLIEQEGMLLKRELEMKLESRLDQATGMVAVGTVGAIGALLTLLTATATAILVLSIVLPGWAAALIVAAAWAAFSAVGLVAFGMVRLEEQSTTTTMKPTITERSVRRDLNALKQATGGI